MSNTDTIFALSSGAGRSGVAVIRVSGPESRKVIERLCRSVPEPRRFARRRLIDPVDGEAIDEGVVIWLPGPGTATGEDMCELHVHGGEAIEAKIFSVLREMPGMRLAEAGEFTRRAFVSGRMDLMEVEGLADLLASRTEGQRRAAMRQFLGSSSSVVESWRRRIVSTLALVDAILEFSEEEDVSRGSSEDWRSGLLSLCSEMESSLEIARRVAVAQRGVKAVLVGYPNVGKSSLLNHLAGRQAAIVTAQPGTTRDVIEVQIELGGWPVVLMDSAGLRNEVADEVEAEGVARARAAAANADIAVWVWSQDVTGSERVWPGVRADVTVQSKSDLAQGSSREEEFAVSTRSGEGIAEFVGWLAGYVGSLSREAESAIVVEGRQADAVRESIRFLNKACGQDSHRPELIVADLRAAGDALGRIVGRIDVEEWLGEIFGRFCIGK